MKGNILALLMTAYSLIAFGQKDKLENAEAARGLSKKFIELFQKEKISESFAEIKSYWPLPEEEIENLEEKTKSYMVLLKDRFGKPIGSLKIKEEKITDIALREIYLVRFNNTAIRIIFTYYRNNEGWILNAFKWDDSYTEEFK